MDIDRGLSSVGGQRFWNMAATGQRLRFAELTSSVGAGALGLGLGALFGSTLRALAMPRWPAR